MKRRNKKVCTSKSLLPFLILFLAYLPGETKLSGCQGCRITCFLWNLWSRILRNNWKTWSIITSLNCYAPILFLDCLLITFPVGYATIGIKIVFLLTFRFLLIKKHIQRCVNCSSGKTCYLLLQVSSCFCNYSLSTIICFISIASKFVPIFSWLFIGFFYFIFINTFSRREVSQMTGFHFQYTCVIWCMHPFTLRDQLLASTRLLRRFLLLIMILCIFFPW